MRRIFFILFLSAAFIPLAMSLAQAPPFQSPPKALPPPPPPAPTTAQPIPPPPAPLQEQPKAPVEGDIPVFQNAEGYNYDPSGRRDPFRPFGEQQRQSNPDSQMPETSNAPLEPLQMFDITQLKVIGIIWQVRDPKAMIKDPNGKTHLIRRQTKIGRNNGFVAAIREGEIIVVEPAIGENGMQTAVTKTLNLSK